MTKLFPFFVALWGLDPVTGGFKDEEHTIVQEGDEVAVTKPSLSSKLTGMFKRKPQQTVHQLLVAELEKLHENLEEEKDKFKTEYLTEKEKGKRLMFLFQKDLMPGISGQILESKGQRDEVIVQGVSRSAKILAWIFLGLLNTCMLFYVFLFAVSQDPYRQRAWAKSFGMWLVMEVIVVSSFMVCFMHVFIPTITMKDVNKIRTKLIDSVAKYHRLMADKDKHQLSSKEKLKDGHLIEDEAKGDLGEEIDPEEFNAAKYLFLSYRLANMYPDLKVSQIIRQFSTPWPKQSYHRSTDMSKQYNRKFAALKRSVSMVAMFFLTNLLTVPMQVQDMIMQVLTTTATGYTILLHVQLYKIYPVLVAIPMIFLAAIIHFVVQSNKSQAKVEFAKMMKGSKEREEAELEKKKQRREKRRRAKHGHHHHYDGGESAPHTHHHHHHTNGEEDDVSSYGNMSLSSDSDDHSLIVISSESLSSHDSEDDVAPIHSPRPVHSTAVIPMVASRVPPVIAQSHPHVNRRQSIQQGLALLHQGTRHVNQQQESIIQSFAKENETRVARSVNPITLHSLDRVVIAVHSDSDEDSDHNGWKLQDINEDHEVSLSSSSCEDDEDDEEILRG